MFAGLNPNPPDNDVVGFRGQVGHYFLRKDNIKQNTIVQYDGKKIGRIIVAQNVQGARYDNIFIGFATSSAKDAEKVHFLQTFSYKVFVSWYTGGWSRNLNSEYKDVFTFARNHNPAELHSSNWYVDAKSHSKTPFYDDSWESGTESVANRPFTWLEDKENGLNTTKWIFDAPNQSEDLVNRATEQYSRVYGVNATIDFRTHIYFGGKEIAQVRWSSASEWNDRDNWLLCWNFKNRIEIDKKTAPGFEQGELDRLKEIFPTFSP